MFVSRVAVVLRIPNHCMLSLSDETVCSGRRKQRKKERGRGDKRIAAVINLVPKMGRTHCGLANVN